MKKNRQKGGIVHFFDNTAFLTKWLLLVFYFIIYGNSGSLNDGL